MSNTTKIIEIHSGPDSRDDRHPYEAFFEVQLLSGMVEAGQRYKLVPVGSDSPKLAHDATDTSQAAAKRVAPRAGTQRAKVLDRLYWDFVNGQTDKEISDYTGIPLNSVRPRRLELVEQGWVRDSGVRRDGSIVWQYVPREKTR